MSPRLGRVFWWLWAGSLLSASAGFLAWGRAGPAAAPAGAPAA